MLKLGPNFLVASGGILAKVSEANSEPNYFHEFVWLKFSFSKAGLG